MAGLWERHVLPRIIEFACGQEPVTERRLKVLPLASGNVLELGIGAGANLALYDSAKVQSVTGVDPSPELRARAMAAPRASGLTVDVRDGVGEALPFADHGFDSVVCTFTLCSVQSPQTVLAEARRVLKPGGQLLFCEHGRSPHPGVQRWQGRIEPLWKRLMGNCHLTRPVTETIIDAGFSIDSTDHGYMAGMPRWASWMEWGRALRV